VPVPLALRSRAKVFPAVLSRAVRHKTCSQHLRNRASPGTRGDYRSLNSERQTDCPKRTSLTNSRTCSDKIACALARCLTKHLEYIVSSTRVPTRPPRKDPLNALRKPPTACRAVILLIAEIIYLMHITKARKMV